MANTFLPGNRLTLLNSGAEYFPALLAAIETAEREIFLESYIFADDEIGHEVTGALCRAAQRGVQVNATVDGFGGRNFKFDFMPQLAEAGVQAMQYRPEIGHFNFARHRLRRLHRKLVVIDARIAFVGGINIVDDHNAPPEMCPRYDYAVCIEGPTVQQIHHAVRHMWEIVSWANFKRRFRAAPTPAPCCGPAGNQQAALQIRDNILHRNDILNAYLKAINSAQHEIILANAYFLPGIRFGRALQAAAKRGVKITILLQGKTDHPMLRFATQALYLKALNHGIEIFEYEKSFMHAKVAVIDSHWATVGSSNIDPFSLLLAKEANIFVEDAVFSAQLRSSLQEAIKHGSRQMGLDEIQNLPWRSRFMRWLSYGLVRALVGIAGYGPKHWQADEDKPTTKPPANK
jgi:cardiolipin synthase